MEASGLPLAIMHTAANVHESNAAIELVDQIPKLPQANSRRRRRPRVPLAYRAYVAEHTIREPLRERGIQPLIEVRRSDEDHGLGRFRYLVESCFEWIFAWRRLRVRYEKRDDIHDAL